MGVRSARAAAAAGGSGDARVDGLLSGLRWTKPALTWSDPDSPSDFGAYNADMDRDGRSVQNDGFGRLGAGQRAGVGKVLDAAGAGAGFAVEGLTNLAVRYAGAGSGAGDIRVANTKDAGTAYGFMPTGGAYAGDVWLGGSGRAPVPGNHDHLTLLHELGHALGLKHSHEAERFAPVPAGWDSPEFTVMSYRAHVGAAPVGHRHEAWGAPQSYMMLDVAALQQLYGADFTTNAGNTTYDWNPGSGRTLVNGRVALDPGGDRIFATVWDGGGRDCYDLSSYRSGVRVDLGPGKYSVFSTGQLADLGGGPNAGHARGNIFNALQFRGNPRSLIEDAIGGSGRDRLIGNAAGNRLNGGGGNDSIEGDAGADRLCGGKGADVFVFRAGDSPVGRGCDWIMAGGGAAAFERAGRSGGDVIDLRAIDADTTRGGNQAFAFGKEGRKGGLWLDDVGSATMVYGNVDRDRTVEFQLKIVDGSLHADDYGAGDFLL